MGFTRTDIQITISNMHQQNIVIVLISIVILTHASENQQQRKKDKPNEQTFTHFRRYQFTQIALHLWLSFFFLFFSPSQRQTFAVLCVKYFTSSCNFRRYKTVVGDYALNCKVFIHFFPSIWHFRTCVCLCLCKILFLWHAFPMGCN